MKVSEKAYMAGMIDGEGSIVVDVRGNTVLGNVWVAQGKHHHGEPLMDWIVSTFGGTVVERSNRGKGVFLWTPGRQKGVVRTLLKCLPFMIVKKWQAKILLVLLLVNKKTAHKYGHRGSDPLVAQFRHVAAEYVQALNQGIDPPAETECEKLLAYGYEIIRRYGERQSDPQEGKPENLDIQGTLHDHLDVSEERGDSTGVS